MNDFKWQSLVKMRRISGPSCCKKTTNVATIKQQGIIGEHLPEAGAPKCGFRVIFWIFAKLLELE